MPCVDDIDEMNMNTQVIEEQLAISNVNQDYTIFDSIVMHNDAEPVWQGFPVGIPEQEFTGQSGVSDAVLDCSEPID